jgi:hypothetical protein
MNTLSKLCCGGLVLLGLSPLWAQVEQSTQLQPQPAGIAPVEEVVDEGGMLVPPPVSGATFPATPASAERSNYLRGGMVFTGAYTDNVIGGRAVNPVSDESYSLAPTVELDKTTSRTALQLSYAPGFTFYQHTSALNEADQNAAINFQYRITEHLTLSARDSFQKSSNVMNQPLTALSGVEQAPEVANFSIIAPLADRLSNIGNAELSYQLSPNSMVGASGSFSNLHYPNLSQVPGLFDASSQTASAFYSHRLAKRHYVGLTCRYERLLSYPAGGTNRTSTNAILMFYSFYPTPRFSFSFYGGPERADTTNLLSSVHSQSWTPEAGASLNWQGVRSSFALSYSHMVASGGGLIGAVHMDNAIASFGQQFTRSLRATLIGGWVQNDLLDNELFTNGHSTSVLISLHQRMGQRVEVGAGYNWLYQSYSNLPLISANPVTNREFVSLSYQFERALGR